MNISVKQLIESKAQELKIEVLTGETGFDNKITLTELNRPGLALAGYFDFFQNERIQIFGRGEMGYLLSLSEAKRKKILEQYFSYKMPLIIITRNNKVLDILIEIAKNKNVCVARTIFSTTKLVGELSAYLEECFAPSMTLHGDLVNVYGYGVIILGESGIGKSETSLELLKRGHQLICDDYIKIIRLPGNILMGRGSEISQHKIEVRGIGIVDVNRIFGIGSTLNKTRIEMVVELVEYEKVKEIDRSGSPSAIMDILGVNIPSIILPIKPGRNISILIEIGVMNRKLISLGINSAEELDRKLIEYMKKKL